MRPYLREKKNFTFDDVPENTSFEANVIKLRKSKIVTGIRKDPVTIFMNIM